MTTTTTKILEAVLALPDNDRLRIAEALFDTMRPEILDEIEREWLEEAQRRAGRLERGEVEARDGDRVMAELEAKLQAAADLQAAKEGDDGELASG